jgi:hypothetical protein
MIEVPVLGNQQYMARVQRLFIESSHLHSV